jgi:uncharacterized OsmC-like protein
MPATTSIVNGIDTDALKQAMSDITDDASRGVCKFQVATAWRGGTKSRTRVDRWWMGGEQLPRDYTIDTDEPPELLGESDAPNPQEVLMAGMNACMMVGYVAGCAVHGITLEELSIETDGELDLRGFLGLDADVPPGYEQINYTVRIKGDGTPQQFQEIHDTVMATSPNFWNISRPIKLNPTLVVD